MSRRRNIRQIVAVTLMMGLILMGCPVACDGATEPTETTPPSERFTTTSATPAAVTTTAHERVTTASPPTAPPDTSARPTSTEHRIPDPAPRPSDPEAVPSTTQPPTPWSASDIYYRLSPAVVSIRVVIPATSMYAQRESTFTGVIIDASGLVITSYTLLKDALDYRGRLMQDVMVQMRVRDLNTTLEGTLVAAKPSCDLALLRLVLPDDFEATLPELPLSKAPSFRIGMPLYCLCAPPMMIEEGGLAAGMLTAMYRTTYEDDGAPNGLIETNIPMLPICSGGPVINAQGEVVAIASGYRKRVYAQNQGFAIPAPIVSEMIDRALNRDGAMAPVKAELGITVYGDADNEALREQYGYPEGLIINAVKAPGAAYTAGVNVGDILIKINGRPMETLNDFMEFIEGEPVGTLVEMLLYRPSAETYVTKTGYLLERTP